jgi:hypothetical protein
VSPVTTRLYILTFKISTVLNIRYKIINHKLYVFIDTRVGLNNVLGVFPPLSPRRVINASTNKTYWIKNEQNVFFSSAGSIKTHRCVAQQPKKPDNKLIFVYYPMLVVIATHYKHVPIWKTQRGDDVRSSVRDLACHQRVAAATGQRFVEHILITYNDDRALARLPSALIE